MTRTLLVLALLILSAGPWVGDARAQPNPAAMQTPGSNVTGAKPKLPVREKAPPALPGARAEPTAVAPAAKTAMELPPTEALFDSVNRGDLAGAKDAVNRGADINGKNVLGLTPLELAVDLGRNEISFLLLSLRGGAGFNTASGPPSARPTPASGRAERLAAARAERAERLAAGRRPVADSAPAAPQTARLFVGGGGAPVPQAGFLGFDAGR